MPSKKKKKLTLADPPRQGTLEPFVSKKAVKQWRRPEIAASKARSERAKEAWKRRKEKMKDALACYEENKDW
jgi:hypothetical protein